LSHDVRRLVTASLAGDDLALRSLVERFRARVFGLCYRMLGHRQDAEDATQESLARAVRGLHGWDESREFAPWLLTIAANRCRTRLAARAKRRFAAIDAATVVDPRSDRLSGRHVAEEVSAALDVLRDDHRRAFVSFHVEGQSYAEIAAACRVPVGTIKTWVHRARREMAARLRERGVVEGRDIVAVHDAAEGCDDAV
jgi:RNA polymerase sigma-70 factor (ECF subfamily)